jgi:small subunit ribosomal protein S9
MPNASDSPSKKSDTVKSDAAKYYATGRRKRSSARVYFKPSKELSFKINGRPLENYLARKTDHLKIMEPIDLTEIKGEFNMKVKGGGTSGQAGALAHGIARVLVKFNEALKSILKKAGLLTRDAREVERKKYGLKKARKAEQYSKR